MNEFLAQNLQYALQAIELLRQSRLGLPILAVVVLTAVYAAFKRPTVVPLIALGPVCSVVLGNWFWFSLFITKNLATEQDWLENTTIALVVGLVVGVVAAAALASSEEHNHWDYTLHKMVWRQDGNVAQCYAVLPIACLVAEVLAVVGLGAVLTIGQNPMEWLLAACLVAGFFGCGGGAVLIIFL